MSIFELPALLDAPKSIPPDMTENKTRIFWTSADHESENES